MDFDEIAMVKISIFRERGKKSHFNSPNCLKKTLQFFIVRFMMFSFHINDEATYFMFGNEEICDVSTST